MAFHFEISAKVARRFVHPQVLAFAALTATLALPHPSYADCVQQMSRIPVAAPAGGAAPGYRLSMLRSRPAAAPAAPAYRANMLRMGPAAAPSRPKVVKAKTAGQAVRKGRGVRKAALHRAPRKPASARQAAVAAPLVGPGPTPMPVAARELATPRAYALIESTVCESGPVAPSALDQGVPVLTIEPGPGGPGDGYLPGAETGTLTPPILEPGFPDEDDSPPLVIIPGGPPPGPPLVTPPVTPVPEPATWALMILGFGVLGARLRATSSAGSGSPGRADRPE